MTPPRFLLAVGLSCCALQADQPPGPLTIRRDPQSLRIELDHAPVAPVAGMRYRLRVESSADLQSWISAGDLPNTATRPGLDVGGASHQFFRLRPELEDTGAATDGAEVFGFSRVFAEELERIGNLTPQAFAELQPPATAYLPALTFEPREASYWDAFNADPAIVNVGKTTNSPGWRSYDFRLNPAELEVFLRNGLVVSERLGSDRFATIYYRIFNDDLPVYVTADSVLHAWHFSYQHMLSELEELQLHGLIRDILNGMANRLGQVPESVRNGPLRVNLLDADYFLAVARSLLASNLTQPVLAPNPHVDETLDAIDEERLYADEPGFELFGTGRLIDFSQFKPRSYYTRSAQLSNYFRALMWTGRIQLRLAGQPNPMFDLPTVAQAQREFATAVTLALLLKESGLDDEWAALDQVINLFVGRTDAMNFAHLLPLLQAAGLTSLASTTSLEPIETLRQSVLQGSLGIQEIPGDVHLSPFGRDQAQLPRTFVFTGQRFVPDGWALAQVTFDRVTWPEDIPGVTLFHKVLRRMPSCLDVAYSTLGNRAAGDLIAQRMLAPRVPGNFRDGFPYAHNLTAVTGTFDRFPQSAWQDTLYTRWLWTLRALSGPLTDARLPEALRTRPGAMRLLNTQMASYTELKHDTLLYGKQPYTGSFLCEYPAGFVEPLPQLWRRLRELAEAAATELSVLPAPPWGAVTRIRDFVSGEWITVRHADRAAARVSFCLGFANTMARLETLADKELRQDPFTTNDVAFIRGLMNSQDHGYVGPTFDGWYPDLFYEDYALTLGPADANGCNKEDALVADVFTAPPDGMVGDIGGVLHEATGPVDLLLITVDNGPDRCVYAGPVLSHFEIVMPGPTMTRLTDEEWKSRLQSNPPPRPEWTQSYLVPSR